MSREEALGVLLLGGGSGGHVLPGLAVAEALGEDARCVAACSDRPVDAAILSDWGMPFEPLPARAPGLRPRTAARFARGWWIAGRRGRRLLAKHRIDVVLATGGFVCPPVAWAARRAGVPIVALALDAVPGRAIRFVGRLATTRLAAMAMPAPPRGWSHAPRTGVPVRSAALAPADAAECRRRLGLDPGRPTLLVTGASQGAATIDALATAVAGGPERPLEGWQVVHLTGGGDPAPVADAWSRAGVPASVRPRLAEMGLAWGAADLALSRAGAGSVAEAAANRVPSIFLPYPWHADAHQAVNAEPLVAIGGAIVRTDHVDTGRNLADAGRELAALAGSADRRAAMRAALGRLPEGREAARKVAEALLAAAGR